MSDDRRSLVLDLVILLMIVLLAGLAAILVLA